LCLISEFKVLHQFLFSGSEISGAVVAEYRIPRVPAGEVLRSAAAGGARRPAADVGVSVSAPAEFQNRCVPAAESQNRRVPVGEVLRPAATVGARRPAAVAGVTVAARVPAEYRIPRLPAGEIRRRAIAVGERFLREDHHRRARPAIARGRKRCRICEIECSSAVVYREHLSGRRHKSRLARKIAGAQHCDICEITIETKAQFDTHLGGRRHRKAILYQAHSADRAATLALVGISVTVPTSARTFPLHLRSAPLPR
jgi:Zinc-finger of C2H2 type